MKTRKIKDLQPDMRPDEKFLARGPKALTDAELLAIILRTGNREESSVELAERILHGDYADADGILHIQHAQLEDLQKINGVGRVKALQVKAVAELSSRIATTSAKRKMLLNQPATIASYYMEQLRYSKKEMVILMLLNAACELICDRVISLGTVNSALFSPRDIFMEAMRHDAVNIILLHNHPSGNTKPSKADIEGTKRIKEAGELIGIPLLDHIIIGDRSYTSFREKDIIF